MSITISGTGWPRVTFTRVLILLFRESAGRLSRVTRRGSSTPVYSQIFLLLYFKGWIRRENQLSVKSVPVSPSWTNLEILRAALFNSGYCASAGIRL